MTLLEHALRWTPDVDPALRQLVEARDHPGDVGVCALDTSLRFVGTDDAVPAQLGVTADRLLGVLLGQVDFVGCDADGRLFDAYDHPAAVVLRTGLPVLSAVIGFEPFGQGEGVEPFRWFHIDCWPVEVDGVVLGVVSYSSDITGTERARRTTSLALRNYRQVIDAVRSDETRFRSLAENAADVVYETDLEARCLWVSPSVVDVLGWNVEELLGRSMVELVHPEDVEAARQRRQDALDSGGAPGRVELRYLSKDGRWRWMSAMARPMRDTGGRITGGLTALRDVHSDVGQRSELEYLAAHDSLTGLLNRAAVTARLADLLRSAGERGRSVAVLYVDLDRFKAVNDEHGHQTGDRLLVQVAHRLTAALRESDVVARLGGDEFLVVLDAAGDDPGYAEQRAHDLHEALRRPGDPGIPASTASVGVAVWDGAASAAGLIDLADRALYRAKDAGRDTVSR